LGVNGQDQSKTIITFNLTNELPYPQALQGDAYPCDYQVTEKDAFGKYILGNYTVESNVTCSYCSAACPPAVVSDKIGFLDGLNWKLVGYSYFGFVMFTVIFQLSLCFCNCMKKGEGEEVEVQGNGSMRNINHTA